jgi:hypothetical protein
MIFLPKEDVPQKSNLSKAQVTALEDFGTRNSVKKPLPIQFR